MKKILLLSLVLTVFLSISSLAQLRLVSPNGGELFDLGKNNVIDIRWEGVAAEDPISIDVRLTHEGVISWYNLAEKATGLSYKWVLDPTIDINYDLIRIRQFEPGVTDPKPKIEFSKTYGGSLAETIGYTIQTNDGGYIMAGFSKSEDGDKTVNRGGGDIWIVKLDDKGNLEWEKTYGGSKLDRAFSIIQTPEGEYVIAGSTSSDDYDVSGIDGDMNLWIIKLDKLGNIIWQKTFANSTMTSGGELDNTQDGGYIISGYIFHGGSQIETWVLKIDKQGNMEWSKIFEGAYHNYSYHIKSIHGGGYAACGYSSDSLWVFKLDKDGNQLWSKVFPNYTTTYSAFYCSICENEDSCLVICSRIEDATTKDNYSFAIIKLNPEGDIIWEKAYGQDITGDPLSISTTKDGGFIFGGSSDSEYIAGVENKGLEDFWIIKLDSQGEMVWEDSFGGSSNDYLKTINQTTDGGFVIGGVTRSDDQDIPSNHGDFDYWLLKLSPEGKILQEDVSDSTFYIYTGIEETVVNSGLKLFPNPAGSTLNIEYDSKHNEVVEIKLLNNLGEVVLPIISIQFNVGIAQESINIEQLPSGSYIFTIQTKSGLVSKSFIKVN
jgi:Secretion system C-terminal sorting domain